METTMSGLGFKVQAAGLRVEGFRRYDRDLFPTSLFTLNSSFHSFYH